MFSTCLNPFEIGNEREEKKTDALVLSGLKLCEYVSRLNDSNEMEINKNKNKLNEMNSTNDAVSFRDNMQQINGQ